ncbi:MAG: dephospho-CoA kinase [Gammaproteobacteria bacterium]|nr:dephospho-CoA kinase [Gammaproteobacteria bacterium]MBU1558779.1 dephospho-CoA kinase [Gammaproteobacteria bacterium]MBU1628459.1 dephospho-CoA kinase [Gammaproteobacteria bacterium]MBU1926455.1 dephospho-CoA kinase [Gammaproteobacteria bacterium]MBU2546564.1 dephospho-CoA kinase [Gammaproteobacteria bacterium]
MPQESLSIKTPGQAFLVGLTGGIGCGKTTVAKLFREHDITIIDADQIAREVVAAGSPALKKIEEKFGPEILQKDGSLDRQKLRDIIFNDDRAKKWLESLLHPLIRKQMLQRGKAAKSPYVIFMIPLLIESLEAYSFLDRILVIDAPLELQIQRVKERDQTSRETIQKIIRTQVSRAERLKRADDVIDNSKDLKHLKHQVDQLHTKYSQ